MYIWEPHDGGKSPTSQIHGELIDPLKSLILGAIIGVIFHGL